MSRKTESIPTASRRAQPTAPPALSADSRTTTRRMRAVLRPNRAKFSVKDCVSCLAASAVPVGYQMAAVLELTESWWIVRAARPLFGLRCCGHKSGLALKFSMGHGRPASNAMPDWTASASSAQRSVYRGAIKLQGSDRHRSPVDRRSGKFASCDLVGEGLTSSATASCTAGRRSRSVGTRPNWRMYASAYNSQEGRLRRPQSLLITSKQDLLSCFLHSHQDPRALVVFSYPYTLQRDIRDCNGAMLIYI